MLDASRTPGAKLPPMGNQWTAPSTVIADHRDEILAAIATGAYLRDIAAKYRTSAPSISRTLSADPDYQYARELALETRLELREKELEEAAPTMAEISRASSLVRTAQWRCEREAPHRWGQRSHVEVTTRDGDLGDRLRRASGRTIDVTPEPDAVPALPPPPA